MPKLMQTVKIKNGHYHIVYINEATGQGITSVNKNHFHIVSYMPVYDEMAEMLKAPNMDYGIPPAMPSTPQITGGNWIIEEAEGHTHNLSGYIPKADKKEKQTDEEIINDVIALWKEVKELESEVRKKAEESDEYYSNKQWKDIDKRKLESENRACLTINEIEPPLDILSGYQRQNKTDIKFFPIEGGDQRVSDILNVIVKNITDQCQYQHEKTRVFEDEEVVGRGCFNIYVSYKDNILGDLIVERYPWNEVYFGPHEKFDFSDGEYLIKIKNYSLAKCKQKWFKKAQDIETSFSSYITGEGIEETKEHTTYTTDQYRKSENKIPLSPPYELDLIDIQRKNIKVLECWRKEYKRDFVFVNANDDFYYNAIDWNEEDKEAIKTISGFEVIEQESHVMRISTITSQVLLEDYHLDLPKSLQDFHIVPVYAKKRGNNWWGKVETVKGMNAEINKHHSQLTDILNKAAIFGYFYDDNTFADVKDEERTKRELATPGFLLKVMDASKPPQPSTSVQFPTEMVNMIAMHSSKVKELMNINLDLAGKSPASRSGIAMVQQKQQGLLGNEFLFDNLSYAERKVAKMIVAYIQKDYNVNRILRIIENQNMKEQVQLAGKPYAQYNPEEIAQLLSNTDLTKYDVAISESPYSPTTRLANFILWSELAGKGISVPPQLLVDLSDLPDKEKVIQGIEQMQQQQMQTEQGKQNMEIQKTLIAAQSKQQR